jgi:hypothetical protein
MKTELLLLAAVIRCAADQDQAARTVRAEEFARIMEWDAHADRARFIALATGEPVDPEPSDA